MVISTIASYGSAENGVGPTWLVDGSSLFADEGPADIGSPSRSFNRRSKRS